ncbi:MAG: inositol monophosphatase [Bordetella sp.]|nr:MAG: inositol monophosphatase [Bordetella sp.]
MHPMLNIAVKAARRAGKIINQASLNLERMNSNTKFKQNYLVEINVAAEKIILETLQASYPNHAFWGEEINYQGPKKAEFQWIIDSLDNTTNFIYGLPVYAISIALTKNRQTLQSVIYDPSRNELFTAGKGNGTFLNNRRIRVSGRSYFNESLLGTNHSNIINYSSLCSMQQNKMNPECPYIRCLGSVVLNLAYVACGRLDGFFCQGLKSWNLNAGSLIVQEAGGLISDFSGNQTWMKSGNILAATPKILNNMIRLIENSHHVSQKNVEKSTKN